MTRKTKIVKREELSAGDIVTITKFRKRYFVQVISPIMGIPPHLIADDCTFEQAQQALIDELTNDVCDS